MEGTVKALEAKLAQMEAKLATKSGSSASASASSSSSSSSASSPDVHSALRIKPESFSAGPGENWLRKFKSIAALNKWNQELQCQILPAYLKGLAEQTYYSLTTGQTSTWVTVERALTDRFHPKESRQVHISTLRAKSRQANEQRICTS